jgi:hypothetical protein
MRWFIAYVVVLIVTLALLMLFPGYGIGGCDCGPDAKGLFCWLCDHQLVYVGIAPCVGTVANGQRIATSKAAKNMKFTVTATDRVSQPAASTMTRPPTCRAAPRSRSDPHGGRRRAIAPCGRCVISPRSRRNTSRRGRLRRAFYRSSTSSL